MHYLLVPVWFLRKWFPLVLLPKFTFISILHWHGFLLDFVKTGIVSAVVVAMPHMIWFASGLHIVLRVLLNKLIKSLGMRAYGVINVHFWRVLKSLVIFLIALNFIYYITHALFLVFIYSLNILLLTCYQLLVLLVGLGVAFLVFFGRFFLRGLLTMLMSLLFLFGFLLRFLFMLLVLRQI